MADVSNLKINELSNVECRNVNVERLNLWEALK